MRPQKVLGWIVLSLSLSLNSGLVPQSRASTTLEITSPDSVITIEADLPDDAEAAEDSMATPEPVSSWEITPMDYAAGQGGYVRLRSAREIAPGSR